MYHFTQASRGVCMYVCTLGCALCCATGTGSCPAGWPDGRDELPKCTHARLSVCLALAMVMAMVRERAALIICTYIHLSASTTTYRHVAGQPSLSLWLDVCLSGCLCLEHGIGPRLTTDIQTHGWRWNTRTHPSSPSWLVLSHLVSSLPFLPFPSLPSPLLCFARWLARICFPSPPTSSLLLPCLSLIHRWMKCDALPCHAVPSHATPRHIMRVGGSGSGSSTVCTEPHPHRRRIRRRFCPCRVPTNVVACRLLALLRTSYMHDYRLRLRPGAR
ncbi:hypothetical protein IWX90DRAFT_75654 [Phyllosticta citrichinensis]|uniref:Uncharacterized protein n=1 Tax=Phyllosticta citrichinensis TaxID=1130410 RepID=A0ABR1XGK3_9PEZI